MASFTEKVVLRAFEVTGIAPLNPSSVVDKFIMWSPSKRREAEYRYDVVQRLDIEKKLKKPDERELIADQKLVTARQKEERRVACEAAAEVRRKEQVEHAKGVAERKAEREHLQQERDAAKAI